MKVDEPAWVEVRNCLWLQEAHVIRSLLAAAGIEAMIPDEYTLGVHPFYALALGGVRVLVRASDWSRAVEFLDATPSNPDEASAVEG
jgi:Putative prokaryotic signal transducing protein